MRIHHFWVFGLPARICTNREDGAGWPSGGPGPAHDVHLENTPGRRHAASSTAYSSFVLVSAGAAVDKQVLGVASAALATFFAADL